MTGKSFIKCPKDPKMQYYREVCKEIFRKGNMRNWCKACEVLKTRKKQLESEAPRPLGRGFCLTAVLRGGEQTGHKKTKLICLKEIQ